MDIIQYLLMIIQFQYQQICWLIKFICKYIPLRQWAFDDSHSPKYQKFKVDKLPIIEKPLPKLQWEKIIAEYPKSNNGKTLRPIRRRSEPNLPKTCRCPRCNAPADYIYRNNGKAGQLLCKVCKTTFFEGAQNAFSKLHLKCPYCSHSLVQKKERKYFVIHKCVNPKCPYYLRNLKKVDKKDLDEDYGKNKYKLHYIYREFLIDFFRFDITTLPKNASSLKFTKNNAHIMSLCLTYKVNLGLSLRKTAQAMKDIHGISISHQMVANYCRTAALCVKPFVDKYPYKKGDVFVADAYSAYPLAARQFFLKFGEKFRFSITQVVGLTNDDAVSRKFRPFKQMIERMNRTYKASYRSTNGFDNPDGAKLQAAAG